MDMSYSEIIEFRAAEIVSGLRKHSHSGVSFAAKALRNKWKDVSSALSFVLLWLPFKK